MFHMFCFYISFSGSSALWLSLTCTVTVGGTLHVKYILELGRYIM